MHAEAKQLADYLGFDATAAKARADKQKDKTLVVKGLWLGMPIEDACQTINHKVGSQLLSVTTDEKSKLKTSVLSKTVTLGIHSTDINHIKILADDSGKVTSFLFSKDILDDLFESEDMPQDEFLQTFIKAYRIPELKSEMREVKMRMLGATETLGFQQVYSYRSPKGFEITFFNELRSTDNPLFARSMGWVDYNDAGSMLLKRIPTIETRESKFD